MHLALSGLLVALLGLGTLLAQIVSWLPPGLVLSLVAFVAVFLGTAGVVCGVIRLLGGAAG